jgi:hypothetical protein
VGTWYEIGVGNFPGYTEGYQSGGMRMEHSLDIRPLLVDQLMERQLDGWLMDPMNAAVRFNLDNVLPGQRSFVDSSGVIQISPFSSRIERFPPDVVVIP